MLAHGFVEIVRKLLKAVFAERHYRFGSAEFLSRFQFPAEKLGIYPHHKAGLVKLV